MMRVRKGTDPGSSPLTRGKRRRGNRRGHPPGLIPAHAGKTWPRSSKPWQTRAHPRSRGENGTFNPTGISCRGSSPLTRGKHCNMLHITYICGLIPAHAGKTIEDIPTMDGSNGSSPLTRGKPLACRGEIVL